MQFEWDEEKASANLKKHGVSFDEALTVWTDYFNIELFDHDHSVEEGRFLILGESNSKQLLIISFTERKNRVRISNARELTSKERRENEHGYFE